MYFDAYSPPGGEGHTRSVANDDAHIYATPSPTATSPRLQPSPHPSHDSQLTVGVSAGAQHYYEFAEGYLGNGTIESHYEMEPGIDDPEYAQPSDMQPYEIPLSSLEASQVWWELGAVIVHL